MVPAKITEMKRLSPHAGVDVKRAPSLPVLPLR